MPRPVVSAKSQSASRRLAYPFNGTPQSRMFEPLGVQTFGFEREGKSYSFDLSMGLRFGPALGGNSEITQALEEDGWLAAMANAKSTSAAVPTLRIYASDDPEADDEVTGDPLVTLLAKRLNRVTTARDATRRSVYDRIDTGEHWWALADAQGNPVAARGIDTIETPVQIISMSGRAVGDPRLDRFGLPESWPIGFHGGITTDWP